MNANGGSSLARAGTIDVNGRIRCECEVLHIVIVANHLTHLSSDLAGIGDRDDGFPLPHGRSNEFHHGNPGIDPRSLPPKMPKPLDI
jgi:error-prone DNA polymerase